MRTFRMYVGRVLKRAERNGFAQVRDLLIGFLIAVVVLWIQLRLGVIPPSASVHSWVSIVWPYIGIITSICMVHFARAQWQLDGEAHDEINRMSALTPEIDRNAQRRTILTILKPIALWLRRELENIETLYENSKDKLILPLHIASVPDYIRPQDWKYHHFQLARYRTRYSMYLDLLKY